MEMISSKGGTWPDFWNAFMLMIPAGAILIGGYMLGYKAYGTIWVPTVVSTVGILITEPILVYVIHKETPTLGSGLGFILGALGMIVTLAF